MSEFPNEERVLQALKEAEHQCYAYRLSVSSTEEKPSKKSLLALLKHMVREQPYPARCVAVFDFHGILVFVKQMPTPPALRGKVMAALADKAFSAYQQGQPTAVGLAPLFDEKPAW